MSDVGSSDLRALGPRLVGGIVQAGDEVRVLGDVDEAGAAPDLQAAAVRVVDQDEGDTVVGPEVADAQILAVAAEAGIGQRPPVEHLEEAARAAADLHVGPAGVADARLIEPVAPRDAAGFGRAPALAGGRTGSGERALAPGP